MAWWSLWRTQPFRRFQRDQALIAFTTPADLRQQRAQDKQVFAFRLGENCVVGPMPDAETELTMTLANEVAKRVKGR